MEDNFNNTRNPHDSFFREVWTNPETVRSFIENYLPQGIVSAVNLDTLEICKDSYVTDELSDFFSDILYKVTIGDDSGLLYFLFEHKSFKDRNIHFQLLQYIVEIWRQHGRDNKKGKLPPIIPIVIYHGRKNWKVNPNFSSAVAMPSDEFKKLVPDFNFILFDLSVYDDKDIMGSVLVKVTLLILKHIRDPKLFSHLPNIFALLAELLTKETGLQYIETLIRYILSGSEYIEENDLATALTTAVGPKAEEIVMTAGDRLVQKGIRQGIQQGIQQGTQQGAQSLQESLEFMIPILYGNTETSRKMVQKIKNINDLTTLNTILKAVKNKSSIDEILDLPIS